MAFLTPADLAAFADIPEAKALAMIADAESLAVLAAPCITDLEFGNDPDLSAALVAILRSAILRWHDTGTGAVVQQGAGPFQQTIDTKTQRRGMFWPSEIEQLRDLCARFAGTTASGAFSVDMAGSWFSNHAPWCNLAFGGADCSCGADIAGFPIYEQPIGP